MHKKVKTKHEIPQHIIDADFADMDARSGQVFVVLLVYVVALLVVGVCSYVLIP